MKIFGVDAKGIASIWKAIPELAEARMCIPIRRAMIAKAEEASCPFLQPSIATLRADLKEINGTLILMLQVTFLALSKRVADL